MKEVSRIFMLCFFTVLVLANTSIASEQKLHVLTLQDCIKKALEISPEVKESQYDVDVYKSKKMQADSHANPQIEIYAVAGPSPRAKQDQIIPLIKDDVGLTINGVFAGIDIKLIQPLYSFGKLEHYQSAAQSGINAATSGVQAKKADIILRIKEIYNTILLAKDLKNLLSELNDDIARSIKKAEKQIEDDAPWADELNIYKLKTVQAEIIRNYNEADKTLNIAKALLKAHLAIDTKDDIDIAEQKLSVDARLPDLLDSYLKLSLSTRPEYKQVDEGVKAKYHLLQAEKTSLYPQIFLGLLATFHRASNRDDIKNPYITDFFNETKGAAFLGMKWAIDFGITKGKIKEAEAEYNKMVEKKRFVEGAVPTQIQKAYYEIQEAYRNISETEKAVENSKKWLVIAIANFDMGIGDAKEIAEAAKSYALSKANNLFSIYKQRQAFASLMHAVGLDVQGK
ncbi:MAG: TolC family protein [Thermodesulfovibrionales bacterium]|nr:TolC family protein [Thermodesulfovibrionales bacterium]